MKISENGIKLIKYFEGFCQKPYKCPAGIPTIGYGATFYLDGTKVKMTDKAITEVDATLLLAKMVKQFEDQVNSFLTAKLNQNQYDALISLSYNIGWNALRKSTLIKLINSNPNAEGIEIAWMKWVHGGGRKLPGLVTRRRAEIALYFKGKKTFVQMANDIMNLPRYNDDEIYL
jgi:lysozyme